MFKHCSLTRALTRAQFGLVTQWIQPSTFSITPSSIAPFKIASLEKVTRAQLDRVMPYLEKHYLIMTDYEQCSWTSDRWPRTQYPKQCPFPWDPLPPSLEDYKKLLPEHVVHLTCQSSAPLGHCEVFLVGMLYGSTRSPGDVKRIINHLKPEVVFLEASAPELKSGPQEKLGIKNKELLVAYEETLKCGGTVVPGDRHMEITEERVWRKMPLFERINLLGIPFPKDKCRCLGQLVRTLEEDLLSRCNIDMEIITTLKQKLDEISPTFVETYIHERDRYMSAALFEEAKKRRCIVAVVGMVHLPGMKKYWKQPVSITTLQDLLTVPPIPNYFKCAVFLPSIGVTGVCVTMLAKMLGCV